MYSTQLVAGSVSLLVRPRFTLLYLTFRCWLAHARTALGPQIVSAPTLQRRDRRAARVWPPVEVREDVLARLHRLPEVDPGVNPQPVQHVDHVLRGDVPRRARPREWAAS